MSADSDGGTDVDADADVDMDVDDDADADIGTANTMRERANESRIKLWIVLRANRLAVTSLLGVGVFLSFVAFGTVIHPPFQSTVANTDVVETMFSTMVSVIITGATLVVTISQLVISQENGPLGEQRTRMSGAMDFRQYTQELIDQPAPADPSAFLRALVGATERRATALRDVISRNDDARLRTEVDEFTESILGNADQVKSQLDGATFGSFGVLIAALNYNYGWKVFQVERIADDHADSLSEKDLAVLDELKTSLTMFGPAREHIKTLYFEWALINLSQLILYISVPALVVAGAMLAFVGEGSFPGATLGVPDVLLVVGGAFTITVLPFLLLVSYIIRIVTVAKRTLAIGPLILRESQR